MFIAPAFEVLLLHTSSKNADHSSGSTFVQVATEYAAGGVQKQKAHPN